MVGNDNGYSCECRGIWVMLAWRLMLSMIDSLLNNVPILNMFAMVTYPAVINDSISYYISCKYQSDLGSELHACFFVRILCYFDAVQTEYGTFTSDPFTMKDAD